MDMICVFGRIDPSHGLMLLRGARNFTPHERAWHGQAWHCRPADLLSESLIRRLNSTDFWCNIG
jgi:hypothetical protein